MLSACSIARVQDDASTGDLLTATDDFLPAVYAELRRCARERIARLPPGQTLGATALVHEVWLRMAARSGGGWASRAQFFAAAGVLMRNILVDRAREKSSLKRGGDRVRVDLAPRDLMARGAAGHLEDLREALERLSVEDARAAQLVTLRFFAGMTEEEAAVALRISPRTVRREWVFAKAWLYRALAEGRR